ncbi:MAG: hypothetical protein AAFX02_00715 [Pseudomonadota bacterium]
MSSTRPEADIDTRSAIDKFRRFVRLNSARLVGSNGPDLAD